MKLFYRKKLFGTKSKMINRFYSCVSRETPESNSFLAIHSFSRSVFNIFTTFGNDKDWGHSDLSYSWKTHLKMSYLS